MKKIDSIGVVASQTSMRQAELLEEGIDSKLLVLNYKTCSIVHSVIFVFLCHYGRETAERACEHIVFMPLSMRRGWLGSTNIIFILCLFSILYHSVRVRFSKQRG